MKRKKNRRPVKPGVMRVEGMKSVKKLFIYNSKKYNYENSKDDTGNAPKTKIQKKNIRRRLTICSGNKPTKLNDFERMSEAEQLIIPYLFSRTFEGTKYLCPKLKTELYKFHG